MWVNRRQHWHDLMVTWRRRGKPLRTNWVLRTIQPMTGEHTVYVPFNTTLVKTRLCHAAITFLMYIFWIMYFSQQACESGLCVKMQLCRCSCCKRTGVRDGRWGGRMSFQVGTRLSFIIFLKEPAGDEGRYFLPTDRWWLMTTETCPPTL